MRHPEVPRIFDHELIVQPPFAAEWIPLRRNGKIASGFAQLRMTITFSGEAPSRIATSRISSPSTMTRSASRKEILEILRVTLSATLPFLIMPA
jgi:hypothetical protein